MLLRSSGRFKWPPRPLSQSSASVLSMRSFLTVLGHSLMSWIPHSAVVVSSHGLSASLSGSSRALLDEYSSSFYSDHVGTRSNSFCSFFGTSSASLTHPDAPDTCALLSGDVSLELAYGLLSPSSSKLWGSFGLSGGGDGSGGCIGRSSTSVEVR